LRATDAVGEQKTIVILVEFSDIKHSFTREGVHRRVFVELNQYIKEVSYGKTWLTGDTTGKWYTMPKKSTEYGVRETGLEYWFTSLAKYILAMTALVSDAVNLADPDVDFSQYRRTIVVLGYSIRGTKWYAAGGGGGTGILAGLALKTRSGQIIKGASYVVADAHLGVYAHEFIHQLGGYEGGVYFTSADELAGYRRVAPDLYDIKAYTTRGDYRGVAQYWPKYAGPWDLMSEHTADPRRSPAGPSSFTKRRLGWIAESQVATVRPGEILSLKLDPLELPTSGNLVVKIPLSADRYYLIENRQQVGYDAVLPGSGVLVYYADETIQEAHGILRLVDAKPSIAQFGAAAFDIGPGRNSTLVDEKNGWAVLLLDKQDRSYRIHLTKAGDAPTASSTWGLIREAASAIDEASRDGRTEGLEDAGGLLSDASSSFDSGQYSKAATLAQQATLSAQKATKPTAEYQAPPLTGDTWLIVVVVLVSVAATMLWLRRRV